MSYNVDSLRGFSEWHKTKLRINTNNHKHTTNTKFIKQAENHRKEIVMTSAFYPQQYDIKRIIATKI